MRTPKNEKERKFVKAVQDVERTVIKASKCRKRRGFVSCLQCPILESCKSFNYDEKLEKKNALGEKIPNSWEIEKRIRQNF